MRINVFEGSRRIVWLIAVIAVAIAGWNLLFPTPYIHVTIWKPAVGAAVLSTSCPAGSQREYVASYESPVPGVSLTVCFDSQAPHPSQKYAARDPRLVAHMPGQIDVIAQRERADYRMDVIKICVSFLAGLFVITYAIGWVVRGFAGIPRGQDSKEIKP